MRKKIKKIIFSFKPFNKRHFSRRTLRGDIRCSVLYENLGEQMECPCAILNISRGGLLLRTYSNKIYPRTAVEIRFRIPYGPRMISVRGEIIRTFQQGLDVWLYSAVRFKDKEEKNIQLLMEYVSGRSRPKAP